MARTIFINLKNKHKLFKHSIFFLIFLIFIYLKKNLFKHVIKHKTLPHRITNGSRSTKMPTVQ